MWWRVCILTCLLVTAGAADLCAQNEDRSEHVCPVSDGRLNKAQAIFAKIAVVLRNPRCINCHGAEDPLSKKTQHAGGSFEVVRTEYGDADVPKTFAPCQSCHGAFPGWKVPPFSMNFTDLDDAGLCRLIKDNLIRGDDFIDHLKRDRGDLPFIGEAFKGTRGFNEEGRSMVKVDPDPIRSLTRDDLVALGQAWIEALGSGKGTIGDGDTALGSLDCGCVPHHYALQLHYQGSINSPILKLNSNLNSGADPLIPIIFNDDRSFRSDQVAASLNIGEAALRCNGAGAQRLSLSASGKFADEEERTMQVKLTGTPQGGANTATCPGAGGTDPGPQIKRPQSTTTRDIGNATSFDFSLPPYTGRYSEPQPLPWFQVIPGSSGSLSITIVKTD